MLGKPLDQVTWADVQAYVTVLEKSHLTTSSRARAIAAIKSLFSFAHHKTGLLKANPAGPVTAPKVKDALAARILSEIENAANDWRKYGTQSVLAPESHL